MSNITKFYLIQIELGRITIDQVPKKYRTDVEKAMEGVIEMMALF